MTNRRQFIQIAAGAIAAGVAASTGLAGASAPSDTTPGSTPGSTPDPSTPSTTAAPTTTSAPAGPTYPLTGAPVANGVNYTPRPALIVKIDNVDAQPQAGLNQADIVFEEIVEGRATRFAAVFNSQDSDPVGPIRSGRTQDVLLFGSYNDPVFAFSGGNTGVTAALSATGWTLLDQGDGMFRDNTHHGEPHNLFGNCSEFFAQAGDAGEATAQFEYGSVTGAPVTQVDLGIGGYSVGWTWKADEALWYRTQQGGAHDTTTGQASTNNVLLILTRYQASGVDSGSPEAQSVGSGDAVLYANGQKVFGSWKRDDASHPFTLTNADGSALRLLPGRTWVELADADAYSLDDDAPA